MPFCTMLYSKINILVAMFRPIPDPTLWEKNAFELFQSADPGSDQNSPGSESTTSFFNLKLKIGQIRSNLSVTKWNHSKKELWSIYYDSYYNSLYIFIIILIAFIAPVNRDFNVIDCCMHQNIHFQKKSYLSNSFLYTF